MEVQDDDHKQTTAGFYNDLSTNVARGIAYSGSGEHIAIATADHRLKVFQRTKDNVWALFDVWRAHDAEIVEICWVDCSLGTLLASIGADNKLKIWQRDPFQTQTRGRCFKACFVQSPPDSVAYVAIDFFTSNEALYISLISQSGLLTLLEPHSPVSPNSFRELDAFYPFSQLYRGDEPRFSLSFLPGMSHPVERDPGDGEVLWLAISLLCTVKIYVGKKNDEDITLQKLIEISVENTFINDICWSPRFLSEHDLLAMACDNGDIQLIEFLRKPLPEDERPQDQPNNEQELKPGLGEKTSGLGARIAGLNRSKQLEEERNVSISQQPEYRNIFLKASGAEAPVRTVKWNIDGTMLTTSDDDGVIKIWRTTVKNNWILLAESDNRLSGQ